MKAFCPQCHQPIGLLRAGVRLLPLKAAIYDAIHAAGDIGITSREILQDVYRYRKKPRHIDTVRLHVIQINDLLIQTNTAIIKCIDPHGHDRAGRWIIAKVHHARHV